MRSVLSWQANAAEGQAAGSSSVVYDCCFNPAGTQLVVACGTLVLVFDATDGLLMHRLRGHKDTVYCVTYAKDGKRFASGGADKNVIIWKSTAEGILKYAHNDSIQALSYNPVTLQLASVTSADFGVWSPDQKSVSKHKISAKGLCCSWTNNGQLLAIGQFDGTVTVRQKDGMQKYVYMRGGPVWSVSFNPNADNDLDILAVAAWDQTLVFYTLSEYNAEKKPTEQRVTGREKQLGMDPCSARYFSNGEYMALSGSDNKAFLWTKDGTKLMPICERDSWIWCVAPRPKQNYVAVGSNDGTVAVYQLIFATVHGLYQERYAYRDFMTDVIIQHLTVENKKVRIKCKDHVKKIAVYKDRLAVQLPDKVLIYELKTKGEDDDMLYCKKDQILKTLDCNLLVVTSEHVILCLERKLQLLNFKGDKEREWVLDSVIRYIKVIGGPPRREGLLVGLKNGQVLKIYVDNLFPIPVVTHERAIRCLDLSASRQRLALVDQNANVVVYDMQTQEKLFEDQHANSVAFNSVLEGQLCYSGKDQLSIKTGDFPVHREKMQGYVVGVRGSKVFCLHYLAMNTVNVPQSAAMYRYLEKALLGEAYKVATMGVTDSDWKMLAMQALMAMDLEVATKAYIKVRDMRMIDLINRIRASRRLPGHSDQVFLAEALALSGQLQEAGKMFVKCGRVDLAMQLYSDLKRWEDARAIASSSPSSDIKDLTREQAQWAIENKDWKTAAAILVTSEEYPRAIQIMGTHKMMEELIDLVRRLDKSDVANLSKAAAEFRNNGAMKYAQEAYIKIGNTAELMNVYMESDKWDEAFSLLDRHPEMADRVYLPYAMHLAHTDRFEEAQLAFRKAGNAEQAVRMLSMLSESAVQMCNFKDAAYYYWMRAVESGKLLTSTSDSQAARKMYEENAAKADIYYAYQTIHSFIKDPFTTHLAENVFHCSRFLLERLQVLNAEAPPGVRKSYILWALAEQATKLGCFKVARRTLDQLNALKLSSSWQDKVDLASIRIRAKPLTDNVDLFSGEDVFSGQRSFINFEVLPVVEFKIAPGISPQEAIQLLNQAAPASGASSAAAKRDGALNSIYGGHERATRSGNTLTFDDEDEDDGYASINKHLHASSDDPITDFNQKLLTLSTAADAPKADRNVLALLPAEQVLVQRSSFRDLPDRYFKHMMPDTPVAVCRACGRMFLEEDFEIEYLKKAQCAFCRSTAAEDIIWAGSDLFS